MSTIRLNGQQRKAGIIEVAIRLFSERGFRGTTTKELASAVGVSEPTLYQHFTTKRELYSAILEEIALSVDRGVPELRCLSIPPTGEDRKFLIRMATGIVTWHQENPAFVRLFMLSALEGHEFSDLLHERYSKVFFAHLLQYFTLRMNEGVYRQMDPAIPAQAFVWQVAHYALELTLFKKHLTPLSLEQNIEGMIEIFMEGIKA